MVFFHIHIQLCLYFYCFQYTIGKEKCLVALRIPKGDRPVVRLCHKNEEGMDEMVKLMTQCWEGDPSKRPKSEGFMFIVIICFLLYTKQH